MKNTLMAALLFWSLITLGNALPAMAQPVSLTEYLLQVRQNDPDIQLAKARVREARARQQDVVKKRFINLFYFFNAENLQGSAESDVRAAEARADADEQLAILEAGLSALQLAGVQLDAWSAVDATLLAQLQLTAARLQFQAGKANRYQVDTAEANWLNAQQQFRKASQTITEQQMKLSLNAVPAKQLNQGQETELKLPDLFHASDALAWAPIMPPSCDCANALKTALTYRPEVQEFMYRDRSLTKLIKVSKLSQRPVLLANQHQLLIKKQKFERSLVVDIENLCHEQSTLAHTLPSLQMAAQQAYTSLKNATADLTSGHISHLEWQEVHHRWVQAHRAWRLAELNQASVNWRLAYHTGQLYKPV